MAASYADDLRVAVAALHETETRYRVLAEAAQDVIFVVGVDDRVQYVNAFAAEQLGFRPEDIVGKTRRSLFPAEVADRQERDLRQVIASGRACAFEDYAVFPAGALWLHTRLSPLRDPNGQVTAVLGISRDITERKRAEEALRCSEARYRTLFEDSPTPMWELDCRQVRERLEAMRAAGIGDFAGYFASHPEALAQVLALARAVDANGAALTLYQAKDREELCARLGQLIGPEMLPLLHEALAAMVAGQTTFAGETAIGTVTGEKRHVALKFLAAPGHEETFAKVILTVTDLTERKRAEEALRESEQKYRNLVELSPHGVMIFQDLKIAFANPAAARMFGVGAVAEMLGRDIMSQVPAQERDRLRQYARARAEGRQDAPEHYFTTLRRRNNEDFPVEIFSRAVAYGGRPAVQLILSDLTERLRAQSEIEQRKREALLQQTESLSVTGRLAAGVAHEINNPLQAIKGHLRLLADELPEPLRQGKRMKYVAEGLDQIARIVTSLLDLHREDPEAPDACRVDVVVRDLAALVSAPLKKSAVRIETALPEGLTVPMSAKALTQALLNLILNAEDAMPGGGAIRITGGRAGDGTFLCVTDAGAGIAAEDKAKLFSPFYTTKGPKGTGLGLAVVHSLVSAVGGRIEVESEPGKGATFRLLFPAPKEPLA